jgi:nitrile hydratase accessory protein
MKPGDEPPFREPWEAQAFAITVKLHEAGHFTWPEWAAALSEEIAEAQKRGDPDLGTTYYHHWLRALERIVVEKELVLPGEMG